MKKIILKNSKEKYVHIIKKTKYENKDTYKF